MKKENTTAGIILTLFVGWALLLSLWVTFYNSVIAIPISFTIFMSIVTTVAVCIIRKRK